jgi:hypothetical protein
MAAAAALLAAGPGLGSTPSASEAGPLAGKQAPAPDANEPPLPPGKARVVLRCQVLSDRSVGACQVAYEVPAGHNLGEAALGMARDIRIPAASFKPDMVGSVVDIPLSFSMDADAGDMPTGKP